MPGKTTTAGVLALSMLSSSAALAQGGNETSEIIDDITFDRESVRCISASAIRETTAVDDRNIVFRLRNGNYFLNTLNSACEGLERENRISFSTPSGRLCNADMIGVIRTLSGGHGGRAGCGLRRFYPITREEAELLIVDEEDRRARPGFGVEDPNAEGDATED